MRYSKVQYLCWLFSGAEISLLKECPTDFNRQASIGFTILMTCLFGALAGGFAASKFSNGFWLATLVFGLVWGLLIFSIDRSMVVTLKKDPERKKQAFWIPLTARAVLAALLAFMISIPLEIYVFRDEIGLQLQKDDVAQANKQQTAREKELGLHSEQQEQTQAETERTRQENLADAEPQDAAYQLLKQQADEKKTEANNKQSEAKRIPLKLLEDRIPTRIRKNNGSIVYNRNGQPSTTYLAGPAYTTWKQASGKRVRLLNEAADADAAHTKLIGQITELAMAVKTAHQAQAGAANVKAKAKAAQIEAIKDSLAKQAATFKEALDKKGFLREYVALENAAADASNPKLNFFLWLIRILFFVIELLPTIVKLATPLGEYDRQLHAHERMFALALDTNFQILEQRERLRLASEVKIAEDLEQTRQDKEIELGKNVLDQTATIQNDLATRMLKEWQKQERDKLKPPAGPKPAAGPPPNTANNGAGSGAGSSATSQSAAAPVPPVAATPGTAPIDPPTSAPFASPLPSIIPAALVKRWGLKPDSNREWYQFENGTTNNAVWRYTHSQGLKPGSWEHPNGDINQLRISFGNDEHEYIIQRLTNTEMILEDAVTNDLLAFTA